MRNVNNREDFETAIKRVFCFYFEIAFNVNNQFLMVKY